MILLGLGLVWLGLAWCGFSGTVVLSTDSTWFGLGVASLGSVRVLWNCGAFPCFCLVWVWFGLVGLGSVWFEWGLVW